MAVTAVEQRFYFSSFFFVSFCICRLCFFYCKCMQKKHGFVSKRLAEAQNGDNLNMFIAGRRRRRLFLPFAVLRVLIYRAGFHRAHPYPNTRCKGLQVTYKDDVCVLHRSWRLEKSKKKAARGAPRYGLKGAQSTTCSANQAVRPTNIVNTIAGRPGAPMAVLKTFWVADPEFDPLPTTAFVSHDTMRVSLLIGRDSGQKTNPVDPKENPERQ